MCAPAQRRGILHGDLSMSAACALGIRQPAMDGALAQFLRDANPWALILFRQACDTPAQVRRLTGDIRDALGRNAIIWIDQEGGRVARLTAPNWPVFPPAAVFGHIYRTDRMAGLEAARLCYRAIAHELKSIGVDGDFAPVLDLPAPGADPIIGDRAFATQPEDIAALGRAALEGLADGGVVGCIKHIPGHGRADADSHLALPIVRATREELERDFAPFRALSDAPAAMTAHVVYAALDPDRCATVSAAVIQGLIREDFGFDGLLMSDDLDMRALAGAPAPPAPGGENAAASVPWGLAQRAEAAFDAGCDVVLQCSGDLNDMIQTVAGCPILSGKALARAHAVEAIAQRSDVWDQAAALARIARLHSNFSAAAV